MRNFNSSDYSFNKKKMAQEKNRGQTQEFKDRHLYLFSSPDNHYVNHGVYDAKTKSFIGLYIKDGWKELISKRTEDIKEPFKDEICKLPDDITLSTNSLGLHLWLKQQLNS